MRSVLRFVVLLAALSTTGAALIAQQKFTSTTSLLTLDVSVLDKDGNPVAGLSPEDFVVTLNKEPQPVRTMVFLANQSTSKMVTARAPGTAAAAAPPPLASAGKEPDPRLFVVMIDDNSIYPTDSKGLFVAAEHFVDSIPARDFVGLTSTSGRMTVNPSLDRTLLMKNLKHAFGWMNDPRRDARFFVGFMDALLADAGSETALRDLIQRSCGLTPVQMSKSLAQILADSICASDTEQQARSNAMFARTNTRNQLDSYIAVINAMAKAPGVKQLVILTGGVALKPGDSLEFIPVAKAAAAAGVQITMLMEEPEPDLGMRDGGGWVKDQQQLLQQAQTLAELSGGQFFRVIGQADRFYQRILTSSSAVYRIGVDLPKNAPPDGKYNVSVTINRPGVKALASRFAAPPPPPVVLTTEEQMKRAITTGELVYAVLVQMSAEVVSSENGSPTAIRVTVEVPGDTPGPVSGIFGIVGPDHQLKSGRQALARSDDGKFYRSEMLVPVPPGAATYDLRFVVSDASGAVGSVAEKVIVK